MPKKIGHLREKTREGKEGEREMEVAIESHGRLSLFRGTKTEALRGG